MLAQPPSNAPASSRRVRGFLAAPSLFLTFLLPGCTFAPLPGTAANPLAQACTAAALHQAEAKGYREGLAAGKRLQAQADHAALPPSPPPSAQPAPAASAPPAAPAAPVAALPPVPGGYKPQGPATPLGSAPAGF
jgi:hypothetical protein